jgi:hypothetical protein
MFFKMHGNGWYMLSGRISKNIPVRRTRNCETGIRSWRTTEPRPAICTVLAGRVFVLIYSLSIISNFSDVEVLLLFDDKEKL